MGKVIGGGLPVGAYGGRKDIMQTVAPAGPMYEARAASHEVTGSSISGMFGFFFNAGPVNNFEDAAKSDGDKFARFHRGMLEQGVYMAPSMYEAGFTSLAHTE